LAVIRRETRGTSTYLHGKLLPDRRHPVKAGSGEAGRAMRASLYRMAPVWLHGDKQVGPRDTLKAPVPVSCQKRSFPPTVFR